MSTLTFSNADIELLARTADALSAYIGKPVLAEIMDAEETGYEWIAFAIPLDINEDDTNIPVIQIGGANARLIGSQGGVHVNANETYSCRFLWAIQCADIGPSVISRSTKRVMKSAGPKSSSSFYPLILMTSRNPTRQQPNPSTCLYRPRPVNCNKHRHLGLALGV